MASALMRWWGRSHRNWPTGYGCIATDRTAKACRTSLAEQRLDTSTKEASCLKAAHICVDQVGAGAADDAECCSCM
jgi:hypothetical protein